MLDILLTLIGMSLPVLFWHRFGDLKLDRDYAPYCYPAIFKSRYLDDGHVDIKPPLIHWSYKLWLSISSRFISKMDRRLRLLPALGSMSICFLIFLASGSGSKALLYGLLASSPLMWNHMANTEWLTSLCFAASVAALNVIHPQGSALALSAALLGVSWLVNVKNLPISLLIAWAIGLTLNSLVWMPLAFLLVTIYLTVTGRFKKFLKWCFIVPSKMGKGRKFFLHTNIPILWGPICEMSVILAVASTGSSWLIVLSAMIALAILAKQLVPHHLILFFLPLALLAEPGPLTFGAFILVWMTRSWPLWKKPMKTYPATFFDTANPNAQYGMVLDDSKEIEDWIRENTEEDERIWVNGMENHVYLYANRKSVQINIPEFTDEPPYIPRVVVATISGNNVLNERLARTTHEVKMISKRGLYSLLVKKGETNV